MNEKYTYKELTMAGGVAGGGATAGDATGMTVRGTIAGRVITIRWQRNHFTSGCWWCDCWWRSDNWSWDDCWQDRWRSSRQV